MGLNDHHSCNFEPATSTTFAKQYVGENQTANTYFAAQNVEIIEFYVFASHPISLVSKV